MVMRDREVPGGFLRWVRGDQVHAWRRKVKADLHNTDGRRIIYHSSESTDKSIEPVNARVGDSPAFIKPDRLKPREARETVELVNEIVYRHWLAIKASDPEAFRRRVRELRAATGTQYAMWTDDQLEANIAEVLRSHVSERTVQRVYEKQGRGGGWRETQI